MSYGATSGRSVRGSYEVALLRRDQRIRELERRVDLIRRALDAGAVGVAADQCRRAQEGR